MLKRELKTYSIPDPESFIRTVRRALQDSLTVICIANRTSTRQYPFVQVSEAFVERLLTVSDGFALVFDLCLSVKVDISAMDIHSFASQSLRHLRIWR